VIVAKGVTDKTLLLDGGPSGSIGEMLNKKLSELGSRISPRVLAMSVPS